MRGLPRSVQLCISCYLLFAALAFAQDDVDQCALSCIANVEGTDCNQSQWSCLCANNAYIERVNNCTYAACDASDQQDTFAVLAELCAVLGIPITIGPEATILTTTSDPVLTIAVPTQSSLPPVVSPNLNATSNSMSGYSSGSSSTANAASNSATLSTTASGGSVSAESSSVSSTGPALATSTGQSSGPIMPSIMTLLAGMGAAMIARIPIW